MRSQLLRRVLSLVFVSIGMAAMVLARVAAESAADPGDASDNAGFALQREVEQVLWGCYLVGADQVGVGDVDGAKATLRKCFTDDMTWQTVMPPAYADFGFSTSNGADGFVDLANQIYRGANYSRVHHLITNIVVKPSGGDALRVTSSAQAIHVFADEHAFSATVKFTDDFVRTGGKWKISHRVMTVVAANEIGAWTP